MIISVTADDLAPNSAGPSAETVLPAKLDLFLQSFSRYLWFYEPVNHQPVNAWKLMGVTQHFGYWCFGAKAPGHQYPQCWLKMHYIGPFPQEVSADIVNNVRKRNPVWKKNDPFVQGLKMPNRISEHLEYLIHYCSSFFHTPLSGGETQAFIP